MGRRKKVDVEVDSLKRALISSESKRTQIAGLCKQQDGDITSLREEIRKLNAILTGCKKEIQSLRDIDRILSEDLKHAEEEAREYANNNKELAKEIPSDAEKDALESLRKAASYYGNPARLKQYHFLLGRAVALVSFRLK